MTDVADRHYVLDAFLAFSQYANMIAEMTNGRRYPCLILQSDHSGKVSDNGTDEKPYFNFSTFKELLFKVHVHMERFAFEKGIPLLTYNEEQQWLTYTPNDGADLIIPWSLFQQAIEDLKREHILSYPRAVRNALMVQMWHVDEETGKVFYSL